ncbi:lysozyme [Pseudomonas coleopterorum]|uniref:lysozyme n=1 Tax=Pseudomonas coleopterorum TaxID=1605838 RepID=UPI000894FDBB|nr:lysozyme [Pseudomonas coleopterorum]SEE14291.1 lysozyme [Pseudomonas coleopterorum]SEE38537.1 lysozyme [Pseudomonas coleopterorum]
MKTSSKGIALIKSAEGLRLKAYPDPGTGGLPWTIGYGSTSGVTRNMVITGAQAEEMLAEDLVRFECIVERAVRVPLNQGQFDALVSFTYNVGEGNFTKSTLLRKLNAGDTAGAAGQFSRWVHAGGKVLPGLVKRRAAERAMFLGVA